MTNFERAMAALHRENYTCVLCDDRRFLTDRKRGILPLLQRLEEKELRGMCVADRAVGRAAAMLLICGGASAVYGEVMTQEARELLNAHGIETAFGTLTDVIRNREGNAPCPMERAVEGLSEPSDAPAVLRAALSKE